jgi:hypothetical protein
MTPCPHCGTAVTPSQRFCRDCGGALTVTEPVSQPGGGGVAGSVATADMTGRPCPYCRFPLKEGLPIAVCSVCGAPHHADCWHDGRGCAVVACAGGPAAVDQAPQAGAAPTAIHPAAPHPQPTGPTVAPVWPPQAPPPNERRSPSLAIAVIVLAIAVGGAAVAIAIGRQSNNEARLATDTTTAQTVTAQAATVQESTATTPANAPIETTSTPEDPNTTTTTGGEGVLPAVSSQQMQSEIQQMLLAWHEDVVNGDYHAAWELLSHRKQAQDSREYGYATWVKNQSTLRPYLNPSGLQVSVESTEPSTGQAQVDVTGMGWDKPGAPCTEWSGITWVKYEDSAWKYDPGYSTTPQREREWKPRFSELLGGQC